MLVHAALFALIGAGAAYLAETGRVDRDFPEVALVGALLVSLLLTSRLSLASARHDEAVACISGVHSASHNLISQLCASLRSGADDGAEGAVGRVHRWLTLASVLLEARLRDASVDLTVLESSGLLTAEEATLLASAASHSRHDDIAETFPSKSRVSLVVHMLWAELARLRRDGLLQSDGQWAALSTEVGALSGQIDRVEATHAKLPPFCYANLIKAAARHDVTSACELCGVPTRATIAAQVTLVAFLLAFPFSVAFHFGWLTPAFSFATAAVTLSIDKVASLMEARRRQQFTWPSQLSVHTPYGAGAAWLRLPRGSGAVRCVDGRCRPRGAHAVH